MGIGSVISGAASWVKNTAEDAVDAGADALQSAQKFVGDRLDDVDQAKAWVGEKIEGAVDGAEQAVDDFRRDLVEFGQEHGGLVGKTLAENVSNTIGVVEGAGLAVYDMGKGVVQLADGAGKLVNPLEWATHGGENLQRLENVGKAAETLGNLASPTAWITDTDGNLNTAKALWDGVTGGYQDAAAQGDWSKFVGRGVVDIGSLLIGVGEANAALKGAQGANAVARLGEGAGALDKAADAARALDAAGDAGKAARGADAAADAGKVARGADEAAAARGAAGSEDVAEIVRRADTGTTIGGKKLLNFDSFDDFNAAANAAQPNSVYQFGDFRWTTDAQGRVMRAEGKVELTPVGRNDPKLQTAIGNEGRDTDVGFHIIADRFGGPTNRLNVVPGNGKPIGDGLPNLNNGAYKRFENAIAELREQGHVVEMRVTPEYNPGNLSSRPDSFVAEYRTDGGRWIEHEFPNK